jgi:hypothetical protein
MSLMSVGAKTKKCWGVGFSALQAKSVPKARNCVSMDARKYFLDVVHCMLIKETGRWRSRGMR